MVLFGIIGINSVSYAGRGYKMDFEKCSDGTVWKVCREATPDDSCNIADQTVCITDPGMG